ncbi:hypothetical protein B0H14DRAFT_3572623 [Mycena olivaceomarginata]|nr:hypothetical protein B0H14DRAFT_3572623 [Mycena olivaceomarginata]
MKGLEPPTVPQVEKPWMECDPAANVEQDPTAKVGLGSARWDQTTGIESGSTWWDPTAEVDLESVWWDPTASVESGSARWDQIARVKSGSVWQDPTTKVKPGSARWDRTASVKWKCVVGSDRQGRASLLEVRGGIEPPAWSLEVRGGIEPPGSSLELHGGIGPPRSSQQGFMFCEIFNAEFQELLKISGIIASRSAKSPPSVRINDLIG